MKTTPWFWEKTRETPDQAIGLINTLIKPVSRE
jgi:hypothetical protein